MKIEGDCAIIETAEEAGCIVESDPKELLEEWAEALALPAHIAPENKITRAQVLEAITPKEHIKGENHEPVFYLGDQSHDCDDDESPYYCSGCPRRCGEGAIKANALTIGKTVGEIRELLAWCNS